MYNIIIIDTNIYRQLGQIFYDHIDYKNLDSYCYSSGSEILITNTVLKEYLDFYKRDMIEKNTTEIENAFDKLKRLQSFKKIRKPNFTSQTKHQIDFIKKKLTQHRLRPKLDFLLTENDLLKFLIDNKLENKKDNTRDYLIWLNTLAAAKLYPDYKIILISEDKIFTDNNYLKGIRDKHSVKNLEIYKNISNFLSIYGFQSDKITNEILLKHIPIEVVKKELLKDKDSIPSHISNFYYTTRKKFKLEHFEIQDIKVDEFYSHKDVESNQVKIIAHVQVKVNMIFAPEKNVDELIKYLETVKFNPSYKLETFDKEARPIYNEYMRFHFLLTFSEETNKITKVEFIDFFPDDYKFKKTGLQLTQPSPPTTLQMDG
jgi:hypothetical protein